MAQIPDGKWYDAGNLTELHEDLATSYSQTVRAVMKRPMLRKHFDECGVCQRIKTEQQIPLASTSRKRLKFIIKPADMARMLGLPEDHEIIFMFATMDPNTVQVIVAGAGLPDAPEAGETPAVDAENLPRAA